jgi:hypothetical protein
MNHVVWHGTADEALALLAAVNQHCACRKERKRVIAACAPHRMLAREQRAIDGLLFMRRLAERLQAEEFAVAPTTDDALAAAS